MCGRNERRCAADGERQEHRDDRDISCRFDGDLYGQKLQLDFFDYLREEKKFSSTQELHDMIAQNAREAEMIVK